MRTTPVTIGGQEYLLCFSVRVSQLCSERYGSVADIGKALNGESEAAVLRESVWLFTSMAAAGRRYAEKNGLPVPPELTEDDVLDGFDVPDFAEIVAKVKEAISGGTATTVDIQPTGNAEATRDRPHPCG